MESITRDEADKEVRSYRKVSAQYDVYFMNIDERVRRTPVNCQYPNEVSEQRAADRSAQNEPLLRLKD